MARRVVIKGTSGVGKTTFGQALATRLGVPHIELDALHWGPGWSMTEDEVFRARVRTAMDACPDGWVIDGNYDGKLGGTVLDAADTIVWLDLPLRTSLRRLWGRTMHRLRDRAELWNGNRETWRDHFASRESLFVYTVRAHRRHRREWPARFGTDPRLVRLRTDAEAQRWLEGQP
jgi:adenylate kinase family enzyme